MEPELAVRPATILDVPSINSILTYYVLQTVITFATTAQTDEEFESKFCDITQNNQLPFFVATSRSSAKGAPDKTEVVGFCYITPWKPERPAYQYTGELSLYVHHEHQGKGIGSALMVAILEVISQTKIREVLAVMAVDEKSKNSGLALRDYYVRWGFEEVGRMKRVGFKFERW